jgi:tRNA threonylcarbamoyladenosine biosynthesis protein TsaB
VRILGIDSATAVASVGLVEAGCVRAERAQPLSGSHARTLLPLIDATLAAGRVRLAEIDLLAVSIGPGSFTGLRIGLSVAKGLALACAIRVVGVPTLDAYAATTGPRPGVVSPVLDARKGQVYTAIYCWQSGGLVCEEPAMAIGPHELVGRLRTPCTLVGDGVDAYADLWRQNLPDDAELVPYSRLPPSGATVAALGHTLVLQRGPDDVARLEPFYCRRSEAELMRERRLVQAGA